MAIVRQMERWFRMTDDVWERHANPWSVWTRYLGLPILALAIWSRTWIGSWAWVPALLTVVWFWLNPRVFSRPFTTDSWASRAVLGEQLWLNQTQKSNGISHGRIIVLTNSICAVGFGLAVYGLIGFEAHHVCYGVVLALIGKSWFLDRMVWLYQTNVDKS